MNLGWPVTTVKGDLPYPIKAPIVARGPLGTDKQTPEWPGVQIFTHRGTVVKLIIYLRIYDLFG